MSPLRNNRARRCLGRVAAASALALTATSLSALAPAQAQSAPLTYDCTTLIGPITMSSVLDSSLPATMAVGQSAPVNLVSNVTAPASLIGLAYSLLEARFAEGTAVAKTVMSGPGGAVSTATDMVVPRTAVPATGDMLVTATGASQAFKPTRTGVYTLSAGDYTSSLSFLKQDLTEAIAQTIPCTPPAAGNRTVDKVTVTKAGSSSASSAKVKNVKVKKAQRKRLAKARKRFVQVLASSKVSGQYGNDPSGTVTFVLKQGSRQVAKAAKPLNGANVAQATFKKKLKRGRYVLTTTYAGNGNLKPSSDVVSFRV